MIDMELLKSETNSNGQNPKRYDLEDRTLEFVKRVRAFVKKAAQDNREY